MAQRSKPMTLPLWFEYVFIPLFWLIVALASGGFLALYFDR